VVVVCFGRFVWSRIWWRYHRVCKGRSCGGSFVSGGLGVEQRLQLGDLRPQAVELR
jgi:hypothetical protein